MSDTDLFSEFSKISQDEWLNQIKKDLKKDNLDDLHFQPELGIKAKAYYHPESEPIRKNTILASPNKTDNSWHIQESFEIENENETNSQILHALNTGCDSIALYLKENTNLNQTLNDVLAKYIQIQFICEEKSNFINIKNYFQSNEFNDISIVFNPLTIGLNQGELTYGLKDFIVFYLHFNEFNAQTIHPNGAFFGEAGASIVQELAISIAQLNEFIHYLQNNDISIDEIQNKILYHLSIDENYFLNIAKFRAIHELNHHLLSNHLPSITFAPTKTLAVSNTRSFTKNDRHTNLLRQSTQAMSAILGGANTVNIKAYSKITNNEKELSERMAKNIQLILKEESYFDKVIDPGAGSYYIENLTDQLIEQSWNLFLEIEAQGGYIKAIENNWIGNQIKNNKTELVSKLNNQTKTLLGVNKFQNKTENWISSDKKSEVIAKDFEAFLPFHLESNFIQS